MKVEGFVKLSEIFRRARFFQSDIGTKAILDLVKIYEQWELDFIRDQKRQGELSDNILKLWRADKITTPPPSPARSSYAVDSQTPQEGV